MNYKEMDYRQIEELQKLNKIKSEKDCCVVEIVVPKELEGGPMSIMYGNCGIIEIAMLVKCLRDVEKSIIRNFPETEAIIPHLGEGGLEEAYKSIERIPKN